MANKLTYNSLFVFSEKKKKYFYTAFEKGVNIVYGKNTSGKSTLFQSIIYCIGINDGSVYLNEILAEEVIFRLDCTLEKESNSYLLSFIRDNETLFIKVDDKPYLRFNGINGNNSVEHVKLKHFLNDLFNFSLHVESKSEYKLAPIETMFLPYYVSQAVGWVYLRKSFSSLDFYRNFKEDYLDYYLGIESSVERLKRQQLQKALKKKNDEIEIISDYERDDSNLQVTKLIDEQFVEYSKAYIQKYAEKQASVSQKENDYILKCNELSFLKERQSVLRKVKLNHNTQRPAIDACPACEQILPSSLSHFYQYRQDSNNTEVEIKENREKIKLVQSKINSLQKSIEEEKVVIEREFITLSKYSQKEIDLGEWLQNKANKKLIDNINSKIGKLTQDKIGIEEELLKYKSEKDVDEMRKRFNGIFYTTFTAYLEQLKVKKLEEHRHTQLYDISSFPSQGVELHKTVMAYHFAFNKLIKDQDHVHRFPFMLDAIFKEDIDKDNKDRILKFIQQYKPSDTQIIFSIAQVGQGDNLANVTQYNADFFSGAAKLICIGEGQRERAFLSPYDNQHSEILQQTFEIINSEI